VARPRSFRLVVTITTFTFAGAGVVATSLPATSGQVVIVVDTAEDSFDGRCDDGDAHCETR